MSTTFGKLDSTEKDKIADFLITQFETSGQMSRFLQEYVWPRYAGLRQHRGNQRGVMDGWYWPGTPRLVTIYEFKRAAVGTVFMQRNDKGMFIPHRKLRRYGFAISGPPQSTP